MNQTKKRKEDWAEDKKGCPWREKATESKEKERRRQVYTPDNQGKQGWHFIETSGDSTGTEELRDRCAARGRGAT